MQILEIKVNARDIIMMQKHNPLCGDKVHIYLKLNKDKNISGFTFEGEGCAISLASASILTDTLKGRDLQFSKKSN